MTPRPGRAISRGRQMLIAIGLVGIDQLSKALVTDRLGVGWTSPGIPGLVDLHLVHNTGAAFSLLSGSTLWLGVLSLLVTVALCRWIWRKPHQPLWNGLATAFLALCRSTFRCSTSPTSPSIWL